MRSASTARTLPGRMAAVLTAAAIIAAPVFTAAEGCLTG